jgi:tetratricopeptide (TPR) repeat protein
MGESKNKLLYLHIGIWKTGTTTIQNTLFQNCNVLEQLGVCYPSISANHTFLPSAFHDNPENFIVSKTRGLSGEKLKKWHQESLINFEKQIKGFDQTVVSSEFLLDLPKIQIQKLKTYLDNLFHEVKVIVYMRHPVDHLSSAINEQVKQGHYGLEQAYKIHGQAKEYEKVENWINAFGKQNIIMRPFEREQFIDKDIVTDFLTIIFDEIPIPNLQRLPTEQNQTLSHAAVLFADIIVKQKVDNTYSGPQDFLFKIKGPAYQAPNTLKVLVNNNTKSYLDTYKKYFGLRFLKDYSDFLTETTCEEIWNNETVESILNLLKHMPKIDDDLITENARLNGVLLSKEGKQQEAEVFFKKAITDNKSFKAFRDYAIFLKNNNRFSEAMVACNNAILIAPERPWLKVLKQEISSQIDKIK